VYHVELTQFPHVARAFNLTAEELSDKVLNAWRRGDAIELGDHHYDPSKARITIYEGRELRADELGMGRGWPNAERTGEDVTEHVLAEGAPAAGPSGTPLPALEQFKYDVLAQCGDGRIGLHQVMWMANSQYPGYRVSDRLALAERAVWELLHQGRLRMFSSSGVIDRSQWEATLLSWETWADPRAPATLLEATGR
jgi:hypothetical protein